MDLILCHTTADFDALGAAVGLTRLKPGAKIVLAGGTHRALRDFLALHRDEYALIERRSVNPQQIRSLIVVDTQKRDRLATVAEWFDLPQLASLELYDHHPDLEGDIPATWTQIEPVGATTTLIVEHLQQANAHLQPLTPAEATVMALGIHVDTGSLTYDTTTVRDVLALAWLMQQGASLAVIADYIASGLSPQLQELLSQVLEELQIETLRGYKLSAVLLETPGFVPGLSSLAAELIELTDLDALLLANAYAGGDTSSQANHQAEARLTIIGRSRIENTDLNLLFQPLGGGGHSQAASLNLRTVNPTETLTQLFNQLKTQVPHPPTARDLMSSPVRTILPQTTIGEASRILLRYGHSGLSVVDETGRLVGIISRRDLDIALHHGFAHAPVKGYMSSNLKTINPDTTLPEIEELMVTYDVGRLPVLENNQLMGIVTRTDVLRQLHQDRGRTTPVQPFGSYCPLPNTTIKLLGDRLSPALQDILNLAAQTAQSQGWHLYLVGGGVRDLLLNPNSEHLLLQDIDLVVDHCYHLHSDSTEQLQRERSAERSPNASNLTETNPFPRREGAGVILAKALQKLYPQTKLQIHGAFQTAALLWHKDSKLGNLWIDIATARTEFYPYPAANPEVEASSIRQDLYRRDFTINALAIRLTQPRRGELLDFFGGLLDLEAKLIRVLHANSFIEDPTRIYRAVRFAVRLKFTLESQTESYIRYALASGVYDRSMVENQRVPALRTRLKSELKYILEADYWQDALRLLGELEALRCIHPSLKLNSEIRRQMRLMAWCLRCLDFLETGEPWQRLLEVLMGHIIPEDQGKVAQDFQLPLDSIDRLRNLKTTEKLISEDLGNCQKPSQIYQLLKAHSTPSLLLVLVRAKQAHRRQIWDYLVNLSQKGLILNGNDLKTLGYPKGPQYKIMLDSLQNALLDGEIPNPPNHPQVARQAAIDFLAQHFPLPRENPPDGRELNLS